MNSQDYEKLKQLFIDVKASLSLSDTLDILEQNGFYANLKRGNEIRFNSADFNIDDIKGVNLCYYVDNKSFYSFSHDIQYDIYSLLQKRFSLLGDKKSRTQVLKYICDYKGIPFNLDGVNLTTSKVYNWKRDLTKYSSKQEEEYEEKVYDESVLNVFDNYYHQSWIDDGISIETMDKYGILWYYRNFIVIPCRNDFGELIGIRGRNVNEELEMKYMPITMLDGKQYNFPTNNYLFGLDKTKTQIAKTKKVIIGESEKFVMQCDSMFGDNNISVGMFGHQFSEQKRDLLLELGVEEVTIALDFDYENINDDKWEEFEKNVYKVAKWFQGFCKVYALVEYNEHPLKCSATDLGRKRFLELYKNREEIY